MDNSLIVDLNQIWFLNSKHWSEIFKLGDCCSAKSFNLLTIACVCNAHCACMACFVPIYRPIGNDKSWLTKQFDYWVSSTESIVPTESESKREGGHFECQPSDGFRNWFHDLNALQIIRKVENFQISIGTLLASGLIFAFEKRLFTEWPPTDSLRSKIWIWKF